MHCRKNTYVLTWISYSMINSETLKHTFRIDINVLTSNGLIIESRYYDFTDNTCIVIILL